MSQPEAEIDELHTELCVLQSHLSNLMDRIRQNDLKLHRFQTLETTLLSLNSLRELVEHVLEDTRSVFDLAGVSFLLIDEKNELDRFLRDDGFQTERSPDLILLNNSDSVDPVFRRNLRPYLGPFRADRCAPFFRSGMDGFASVALLPLCRRGRLLGSLNLASEDPDRFCEQMATDFLDRLSCILSVCLENTLNFELLRRTSLIDTLTGVNNRRYFEQRMSEEIDRAFRAGEQLSCLFVDIDHFKSINDTHGHQSGDRVLVDVAQTIRSMLRNNDVLARFGGEEFVVLLSGTSNRVAIDVAERIRRKIAEREFISRSGGAINVRLSIGVATLDPCRVAGNDGDAAARLLEAADASLYQAKHSGRNRVVSGGCLVDPLSGLLPQYAVG